jgi:hypothetical protein
MGGEEAGGGRRGRGREGIGRRVARITARQMGAHHGETDGHREARRVPCGEMDGGKGGVGRGHGVNCGRPPYTLIE